MTNPPPINSKPPPILLRPRPLDRQIPRTHNALPQVIKAMVDVVLLRLQQHFLDRRAVVAVQRLLGQVVVVADVREAVQLVEERDVVDGAVFGFFAWGEVVGGRGGDKDEAVARGHEGGPGGGGLVLGVGDEGVML